MNTKIINIEGVGNVCLKKSNRARNVSITIKPFEGVSVSVPRTLSFKSAEKIVNNRQDWIKRHLPRIEEIENKFTIFDEGTNFETRNHALQFEPCEVDSVKAKISDNIIKIIYPDDEDIRNIKYQVTIRKAIEEAWRIEAKQFIPERVKQLSEIHGFKYNNIYIKNIKSRWGSCSFKDNLNFTLHLMRLPDYLIDYVILHELCHTIHKNHGKEFWALLNKVSGNAKDLRNEMKSWEIKIY
ncbi:MAG: M48 family metallopeptidase [Bacteroidales bacterium]|nr:M48 family metallopeptidase [Bacteroidales bacterium]